MWGKRSFHILLAFAAASFVCSRANAELPRYLTMAEAEKLAIENSHQVQAQKFTVASARETAEAQNVKRFPMLSVQGSSKFNQKVGTITIPSAGITQQVGSHYNWLAGAMVDWVAWDFGEIYKKAKSLRRSADSQADMLEYDKRQVLLNARTAYVGVQLAREQLRLLSNALALSRDQYNDILNKKEAGTASLLDLTTAHQDVSDYERDYIQAKGDLYVRKRMLFAALGLDPESKDAEIVQVEPISVVLTAFLPRSQAEAVINEHPEVSALEMQRLSANLAADSTRSEHFPKLTLSGSSTFEYPNLGQLTTIQQNSLSLGLKMPVLDWGLINKEVRASRATAHSALEQKKQTIIDLSSQLAQTRDLIEALKAMRVANAKAVRDAVSVARLTYDAFKIGQVIYLEVQRANYNAVSAQIQAAQTDANLITQIATLLSLAEGVEE